jgi:hypothetical protein
MLRAIRRGVRGDAKSRRRTLWHVAVYRPGPRLNLIGTARKVGKIGKGSPD